MREFLFRGKYCDSDVWGWGSLCIDPDGYFIYEDEVGTKVIPETVGEFIGSMDCRGNKIFTGDIIRMNSELYIIDYAQRYHRYAPVRKGVVFASFDPAYVEVVGNVTDFPQMAEEIMNNDHDKYSPPDFKLIEGLIEERNNSGLIEE